MAEDRTAPDGDQAFLALLTHRGWLTREQAAAVLRAAAERPFDEALLEVTGWSPAKLAHLRRTDAMQRPEIPGYDVEARLGVGGTAEVFRARRRKDFRRVALKVLRPDLARDPVASRRFLEEARLLKELDVPGVVRGHRVLRFLDTLVLDMEYVPGRTLEEMLAEGHEFDEREALGIVLGVARALEGLREHGLVHRDLKPGNVMVTRDGEVALIDLGFAARAGAADEGEGTTLGTPAYLAPEQARGQADLDSRADVYSLGATLYHLLVGRLPFDAEDDEEMLRKQVLEGLSGKALKDGRVSPTTHYFLEKMMAKDRAVRYPTPAALVEDLEAHLAR